VDPEPLAVAGDPTELHQVLLNLCMNARDAMAESGGSLTVGLRTARAGERPAATAEDAGWVLLTVRDTGCGMAPDVQRRIFEPYFTTKARGKGTGLGLSVTQGIVAALGGEVRVRSAPSQGSTFEVLLPKVGRPVGEPSLRPLLPRGQGERVLVVDDEPAIRMALVRILRSLGYQPTEVATAGQVLTALRAAPRSFDALLADQTMPGMTGVELAAACAALRADLPIVLCTGDAGVAAEVGAGPGPLRGLLRKPFTIEEVATVLRSALTP
jgi:CheY-like chemotaxis protein